MVMQENTKGLYAAFKAKDVRFDGRFFVGISSTGIYCRPVCRARQPKAENCTFFRTAAAAEQAGYRPCLLCRPELAPGSAITDATANLVCRAARMLERNCGSGQKLREIAERLGCTDRHLRRAFTAEYHVSPVQYLQTCRLLLAKSLLTDTNLSVLEVAMAAGFGSLRRFNDLFKIRYQLTPTALRKRQLGGKAHNEEITLMLGYRPPYIWDKMLKFLSGRAIRGIEVIKNDEYLRTVQLKNAEGKQFCGWVRVGNRPAGNALSVTVSESLLPVLSEVLARIKNLFDLYCEPNAVYETLKVMNDLRPGAGVLGTRVPGCFNTFETSVRAVLGQQVTVKAASTLAARFVAAYGSQIQTGIEGLTHSFPTPEKILALGENITKRLGKLGIISARANTIYQLAVILAGAKLDFEFCGDPEEEIQKLQAVRGIGSWTAQYIAMRTMSWPDAFLATDAGIKKALPGYTAKELQLLSEEWRPWRSYATVNLWNIL